MSVSTLQLYVFALLIRLFLILYGEWQDRNFELKFTDVDYYVFTDAAKYVFDGQSPYLRETYRYTPLLAWLLVPCHFIHMMWGKVVFVCADLITGLVIQCIMKLQSCSTKAALSMWFFNPITMTISARGNAESIMSALLVSIIYSLYLKRIKISGVFYGLSIHFKIFPVVSALSIFLFLGNENDSVELLALLYAGQARALLSKIFSRQRLEFFLATFVSLTVLSLCCYMLYGFDFLESAYFYHVRRKDIRHNFSVYFYMMYTNSFGWLGALCFISQALVVVSVSFSAYKDLPLSVFLLTFSFVSFNKICTSQYFLWYLTLIPIIVPGMKRIQYVGLFALLSLWLGGQSFWLLSAYRLEIVGESVFLEVWLASLFFFCVNTFIVLWFLRRCRPKEQCKTE